MSHANKLSLTTAMLICMNVMFGTGVFINTVPLAREAGALGFFSYCLIALLALPLMLSMAAILAYYPSGGFYTYAAATISPFAGFVSAWAYFVGKLASAALLVNVFVTLLKNIFPALAINSLLLNSAILILFAWLNLHRAETGRKIMYLFMVLKLMPILFAILSCLYLFNYWSMPPETFLWEGIPATLPLVLYAFIGFEVATSISRNIENARENAPKVILYSYFTVITFTIVYQLFFFLAVGTDLMAQTDFLGAFPALLHKLMPTRPIIAMHAKNLIHLIAATSALGGAYGILFSNHWNLYALAQHKHTWFSKALTRMNKYEIPFWGVILEAVICISYLALAQGKTTVLQQISVFGCLISYAFTIIALLKVYQQEQCKNKDTAHSTLLPWLAILSCLGLSTMCVRNLLIHGPTALYAFFGLIALGIVMFIATKKEHALLDLQKH
ncbi:MAG: APC family permease [Candidatus Babeliales bacterium]